MIITVTDLRQSSICLAGARGWWRRRNLNWHDFLKNGINDQVLLDLDDAQATRVVEEAHGRR